VCNGLKVFTVLHTEQQQRSYKIFKVVLQQQKQGGGEFYQDKQFTYDVTLKRLPVNSVAVEKKQ
jgi:hypothetical protein